jgi:hypothetical protein
MDDARISSGVEAGVVRKFAYALPFKLFGANFTALNTFKFNY